MLVILYCIITVTMPYWHSLWCAVRQACIQCMLLYALRTAGRDDVVEFLLSIGASVEVIM